MGSPVEFGPFRLDLDKRVLWRGSELVGLTPKAVDLLAVLVAARGDVVTKQALLERVWPDAVVGEANLSVTVSALRRALGPAEDGGQYVVTVPRRGYRFGLALPPPEVRPLAVAVLPFRPLGNAEDDRHLGMGMADAVIARLTRLDALSVCPPGSVRKYVDHPIDPVEAGRLLGVDAVIEGSLQRLGSRVRVSVHLVPLEKALVAWSDTLEEELPDIFDLQDAVAERLVEALRPRLGISATPVAPAPKHRPSTEAYESYLRGRYFWSRLGAEDLARAFDYFQQAASQDPGFALPHAGLAEAYVILGFAGLLETREAWSLAESSAREALSLDEGTAEAHIALGFVSLLRDWDWRAARDSLERAVSTNPGDSSPRQWLALLLALEGDVEGAGREIDRARALDPLAPIASTLAAFQRSLARQHAQELELARRVVELDPGFFLAHWTLGLACVHAGLCDEAIAAQRRAVELGAGAPFLQAVLAWTLASCGRRDEAERALADLEPDRLSAYQHATVLAALGDRAAGLERLAQACEGRDPWMVVVGVDPMLDPLRDTQELEAIVRRVRGGRSA